MCAGPRSVAGRVRRAVRQQQTSSSTGAGSATITLTLQGARAPVDAGLASTRTAPAGIPAGLPYSDGIYVAV